MANMDITSPLLWCSPGIHLVRVDEDVVILDVGGDQYHCLPGSAKDLKIGEDGRIGASDPAILADLVSAGFATPQPPARPRSAIRRALRELPPGPAPRRSDILRAGLALAVSTAAFRGKSLARLTTRDAAPRDDKETDEAVLAPLVAAARAARPWIPFEGECLQRAFQLRHLLARRGIAVDWIFGVRTWPFGAHCWLQIGDLVVGDRLERVGRYTPIMRA